MLSIRQHALSLPSFDAFVFDLRLKCPFLPISTYSIIVGHKIANVVLKRRRIMISAPAACTMWRWHLRSVQEWCHGRGAFVWH